MEKDELEKEALTVSDVFLRYLRLFWNYDASQTFRPMNKVVYDFAVPRGDFTSFTLHKLESLSSPSLISQSGFGADFILATYRDTATGFHYRQLLFRFAHSDDSLDITFSGPLVFPC